MQTFTPSLGSWLRRLSARNPLVRTSDRIEAAAMLLVFVVALLATPVAGALGTATYDNLTDRFAADRLNRQEVTATATDDSILAPRAYEEPFLTPIRWQFAGNDYTEEVRTYRMKAGEQLTIWIDTEGNRTKKPLTDENAATEAVVTAFGLWFATVGVAAAAWTILRIRLNRLRYAGWDRELDDLADNGGRTNHNT
jgi:hypothetical protein